MVLGNQSESAWDHREGTEPWDQGNHKDHIIRCELTVNQNPRPGSLASVFVDSSVKMNTDELTICTMQIYKTDEWSPSSRLSTDRASVVI